MKTPQQRLAVVNVPSVHSTSDLEQIGLQLPLESVQCHLWSPQSSRKTVPQRWSRDSNVGAECEGRILDVY